jgi:hypothetical protein
MIAHRGTAVQGEKGHDGQHGCTATLPTSKVNAIISDKVYAKGEHFADYVCLVTSMPGHQ